MLLHVGIPPRLTRSVSQRGEKLLKAQRLSLSPVSAFFMLSSLPPPKLPDLTPVKQIKPLLEALSFSDLPADPPLQALAPPEPPDPPDATLDIGFLLLFGPPDVVLLLASFFDTSFRPFPQAIIQISNLKPPSRMEIKNGGGGGVYVSASDTSFAYVLLFPVVYRSLFGYVDLLSLKFRFDFLASPPLGDVPMDLVSFGSTFANSSGIYIALVRSTAVCSFLTGSIPDVGIAFLYLSSWWQVEEKLTVTFIPMNMVIVGYDFLFVPRLKQSLFLLFPLVWSKLDEQALLVLQRSSSHRMLFSAYGAVCVVLRVTLDAIFQEAYDIVVI